MSSFKTNKLKLTEFEDCCLNTNNININEELSGVDAVPLGGVDVMFSLSSSIKKTTTRTKLSNLSINNNESLLNYSNLSSNAAGVVGAAIPVTATATATSNNTKKNTKKLKRQLFALTAQNAARNLIKLFTRNKSKTTTTTTEQLVIEATPIDRLGAATVTTTAMTRTHPEEKHKHESQHQQQPYEERFHNNKKSYHHHLTKNQIHQRIPLIDESSLLSNTYKKLQTKTTTKLNKNNLKLIQLKLDRTSNSNNSTQHSNSFGFTVIGYCPCQIGKIESNSVASNAGLMMGDLIVKINGKNVTRATCDSIVKIIKNLNDQILVLDVYRRQINKKRPEIELVAKPKHHQQQYEQHERRRRRQHRNQHHKLEKLSPAGLTSGSSGLAGTTTTTATATTTTMTTTTTRANATEILVVNSTENNEYNHLHHQLNQLQYNIFAKPLNTSTTTTTTSIHEQETSNKIQQYSTINRNLESNLNSSSYFSTTNVNYRKIYKKQQQRQRRHNRRLSNHNLIIAAAAATAAAAAAVSSSSPPRSTSSFLIKRTTTTVNSAVAAAANSNKMRKAKYSKLSNSRVYLTSQRRQLVLKEKALHRLTAAAAVVAAAASIANNNTTNNRNLIRNYQFVEQQQQQNEQYLDNSEEEEFDEEDIEYYDDDDEDENDNDGQDNDDEDHDDDDDDENVDDGQDETKSDSLLSLPSPIPYLPPIKQRIDRSMLKSNNTKFNIVLLNRPHAHNQHNQHHHHQQQQPQQQHQPTTDSKQINYHYSNQQEDDEHENANRLLNTNNKKKSSITDSDYRTQSSTTTTTTTSSTASTSSDNDAVTTNISSSCSSDLIPINNNKINTNIQLINHPTVFTTTSCNDDLLINTPPLSEIRSNELRSCSAPITYTTCTGVNPTVATVTATTTKTMNNQFNDHDDEDDDEDDDDRLDNLNYLNSEAHVNACERLLNLEEKFIEFMQKGVQQYSRPLRHCMMISHVQHHTLFQNIEKILAISEYQLNQLINQDDSTLFDMFNTIGKLYENKMRMSCEAFDIYLNGIQNSFELFINLISKSSSSSSTNNTNTNTNNNNNKSTNYFSKFLLESQEDIDMDLKTFLLLPLYYVASVYECLNEIKTNMSNTNSDYLSLTGLVCRLSDYVCKSSIVFDKYKIDINCNPLMTCDDHMSPAHRTEAAPAPVPELETRQISNDLIYSEQLYYRQSSHKWKRVLMCLYKDRLTLLSLNKTLTTTTINSQDIIKTVYLNDLVKCDFNLVKQIEFQFNYLKKSESNGTNNASIHSIRLRANDLNSKHKWKCFFSN